MSPYRKINADPRGLQTNTHCQSRIALLTKALNTTVLGSAMAWTTALLCSSNLLVAQADKTTTPIFSDNKAFDDNHHGTGMEWPYLIVGGGGGKLKLPGRYLRYPKYGEKGCRTIGDWWTTLLNAYGNRIKYYGNEDLVLKQNGGSHAGPLEELFV